MLKYLPRETIFEVNYITRLRKLIIHYHRSIIMPPKHKNANSQSKLKKVRDSASASDLRYTQGRMKTKGSWFSIIFCSFLAIFFLWMQMGMTFGHYLSWLFRSPSIFSYMGLAIIIAHATAFLATLIAGFVFNVLSKAAGSYKENSTLLKIDIFVDQLLWWVIPFFLFTWFLIHIIFVDCVSQSCI